MNDTKRQSPRRYHRQMLLPQIDEEGQQRLRAAHALVVGCGALGCVIVDVLARAGIGTLTIIDRDLVDLTNLHRQILFDERDAEQGIPKAEAAKARVARINREVTVHAHVDDFNHDNAESYIRGADLLLDGLDNFATRYLLNDLAVKHGLPCIHGGAVGTEGTALTILPHPARRVGESRSAITWTADQSTPCLRCVFPRPPAPGSAPTCDTAGVLGPLVMMIASHQAAEAIKLLTGNIDANDRSLLSIDAWSNRLRRVDVSAARDAASCPCCGKGHFEFLAGRGVEATGVLRGLKAVQITPPRRSGTGAPIELPALARRLAPHGQFKANRFLVRGVLTGERGEDGEPIELTVFPGGRAIIRGTGRPETARSVYARYIGA
jgi:molybdopterin/thiamine biosynthesis adenylyltransferase